MMLSSWSFTRDTYADASPDGNARHYIKMMRQEAKQAKKGYTNEVVYLGSFLVNCLTSELTSSRWRRRVYRVIHKVWLPALIITLQNEKLRHPEGITSHINTIRQAQDDYRCKKVKYPLLSEELLDLAMKLDD